MGRFSIPAAIFDIALLTTNRYLKVTGMRVRNLFICSRPVDEIVNFCTSQS